MNEQERDGRYTESELLKSAVSLFDALNRIKNLSHVSTDLQDMKTIHRTITGVFERLPVGVYCALWESDGIDDVMYTRRFVRGQLLPAIERLVLHGPGRKAPG